MKNMFKALSLLLVLIVCLASCDTQSSYQTHLDTVNSLLEYYFPSYSITVTVESDNWHKITEKYTVRTEGYERFVDYRVEKLNAFETTNSGIVAPEEYITVTEGTVSIVDVNNTDFSVPEFDFSKNSLKNINYSDGILKANIISLSSFMDMSDDGSQGTVEVSFDNETLNYILVCYTTTNGNFVVIQYTFN